MKVLFVSQYFPPEGAAPAARIGETAALWAAAGHDVRVLTGFPNYPNGIVQEAYRKKLWRLIYREDWKGVGVIRTWLWARPNRGALDRILYYFSFCFSAFWTGLFLSRPDVVVATSPPPFVALTGLVLAGWKRVPFVFDIRDLWPESLTVIEGRTGQGLLARVITRIARLLYRRSDHLVVASPAFKPHLHEHWGVPLDKISVVENGIFPDFFSPEGPGRELRVSLGVADKVVATYSGTIGVAHGLDTILEAAELLKQDPRIVFFLIGDGAERPRLEEDAQRRGLANVRFLGLRRREEIPALLRASDVSVVLLKKSEVFKTVIPSKMLESMASGKPTILGVDGQGREILEAGKAGIAIEPGNARALADAIVRLAGDPAAAAQFGRSGREHVLRFYARPELAKRYMEALGTVVRGPSAVAAVASNAKAGTR